MPQFDFRGIIAAPFELNNGTPSYGDIFAVGDAMNCTLELRFAEGRLYAESTLAEYMRKATGGTVSIGVKYIPYGAQEKMYGAVASTKTLANGHTVSQLRHTTHGTSKYVGIAFYAPDMIDTVEKFTCVCIHRALFGPPSMTLETLGENIVFQTPTTSGEFLANNPKLGYIIDTAVADTEEDAIAWTYEALGGTAPSAEGESDASLSALTVGSAALAPTFSPSVLEYVTAVSGASGTVTATPTEEDATVEIYNGETDISDDGVATWASGANVITVIVTAPDGTTQKTFKITALKS